MRNYNNLKHTISKTLKNETLLFNAIGYPARFERHLSNKHCRTRLRGRSPCGFRRQHGSPFGKSQRTGQNHRPIDGTDQKTIRAGQIVTRQIKTRENPVNRSCRGQQHRPHVHHPHLHPYRQQNPQSHHGKTKRTHRQSLLQPIQIRRL